MKSWALAARAAATICARVTVGRVEEEEEEEDLEEEQEEIPFNFIQVEEEVEGCIQ